MSLATTNVGNRGNQPDETGELLSRAMYEILGIRPGTDPTFYKLLGIDEGETNPDVISNAADRQLRHVRTFQTSKKYGSAITTILNRIANGRVVLLNADQKTKYDEMMLRARNAQQSTRLRVAAVVPSALPVAIPLPPAAPATDMPTLRVNPSAKQNEEKGFRKYLVPITAAVTLTAASIGGVLWATSSSGKGSNETVTAKAELQPGKSDPPVTPAPVAPVHEGYKESVTSDRAAHIEEPAATEEEIDPPSAPSGNAFVGFAPETPAIATPPTTTPITPPAPAPRRGLQDLLVAEANDSPSPEAETIVVSEKEVSDMKATLEDVTKATSGTAKIDAILAFGKDPDMIERPAALKAIYELAFDKAVEMNDLPNTKRIYNSMTRLPTIFPRTTLDGANGQQMRMIELMNSIAASKEMKRPEKAKDRQKLADELIAFAQEKTSTDTDTAIKLLNDARAALGFQPTSVKNEFAKRATETGMLIKEAQEQNALAQKESADFERANAAILADPNDGEAHTIRGQIHLSRGNQREALEDLAVSNHAKATLAADTLKTLDTPLSDVSGKATLAIAHEWEQLANKSTNGKQVTLRHFATSMFKAAIAGEKDPLNPIEKKLAQNMCDSLKSADAPTKANSFIIPSEKGKPTQSKTVMKEIVNIFENIDPTESEISGKWTIRNGTISSDESPSAKFQLPIKVESNDFDIELSLHVIRKSGTDSVDFNLPIGPKSVSLIIDGWSDIGGFSCLSDVDGKEGRAHPAAVKGLFLEVGKEYLLTCRVMQKGENGIIVVTIDGKKLLMWSGNVGNLRSHTMWQYPAHHFGIGSHESSFAFKSGTLKVHSGVVRKD